MIVSEGKHLLNDKCHMLNSNCHKKKSMCYTKISKANGRSKFVDRFVEKGILLLLCVFCAFLEPINLATIIGFLTAVSFSALCSYFENDISRWLCLGVVVISVFYSGLYAFMPLIAYDCFKDKNRLIKFCWIVPLIIGLTSGEPIQLFGIIVVCILAVWMSYCAGIYENVTNSYFDLQDETKEHSMALERKNRELMEKQDYEVRLATLSERNRIAREIHDNVGHLLTRAILQVGALQIICSEDRETGEHLSAVKDTLSDAMDNIRSSVHDLHDESIDLKINLCMLIEEFAFCPVKLNYDADNLPKDIKYCFMAITKEALSNIAKHSDATEAHISVLEHPGIYQLIINDNGTNRTIKKNDGIGLQNMRDRVEAFRGTFRADYDKGFRIFISIPKER